MKMKVWKKFENENNVMAEGAWRLDYRGCLGRRDWQNESESLTFEDCTLPLAISPLMWVKRTLPPFLASQLNIYTVHISPSTSSCHVILVWQLNFIVWKTRVRCGHGSVFFQVGCANFDKNFFCKIIWFNE